MRWRQVWRVGSPRQILLQADFLSAGDSSWQIHWMAGPRRSRECCRGNDETRPLNWSAEPLRTSWVSGYPSFSVERSPDHLFEDVVRAASPSSTREQGRQWKVSPAALSFTRGIANLFMTENHKVTDQLLDLSLLDHPAAVLLEQFTMSCLQLRGGVGYCVCRCSAALCQLLQLHIRHTESRLSAGRSRLPLRPAPV